MTDSCQRRANRSTTPDWNLCVKNQIRMRAFCGQCSRLHLATTWFCKNFDLGLRAVAMRSSGGCYSRLL